MKRFCGKCGAPLDESGHCPNCDRKNKKGEGPYTKGQDGLRGLHSSQSDNGSADCSEQHTKNCQESLRKAPARKKGGVGLLTGGIILVLILAGSYFVLRSHSPSELQQSISVPTETRAAIETIAAAEVFEEQVQHSVMTDPIPAPTAAEQEVRLARGDFFVMGAYPNDKSPISWLVLDVQGNYALVVSSYALDCRPYHLEDKPVTWETCDLRRWLNRSFYNTAFKDDEKDLILTSTVRAHENPQYNVPAGNDTEDRIFLLSIQEAQNYLPTMENRVCIPSSYAVQQGAYVNADGNSWWWLRTPGCSTVDAASINSNGSIDFDDGSVTSHRGTVRPAMWIRISQ